MRTARRTMPAAIEGQETELADETLDHTVPDALIERERMDQHKARSILRFRGAQRIDDRTTVRGREYPGLHIGHGVRLCNPSHCRTYLHPPIQSPKSPHRSRNCGDLQVLLSLS